MIKRISSLLVAAFVVGGLSFGAAQLRAGEATDCVALGYEGPCEDEQDCHDLCIELIPENNGAGICFETIGCCRCAWK